MDISTIQSSIKNNYSKPNQQISEWVRSVGLTLENRSETDQMEHLKEKIDIALRAQVLTPALDPSQTATQPSEQPRRASGRRRSSASNTIEPLTPEVFSRRRSELLQKNNTDTPLTVESLKETIREQQRLLSRSRAEMVSNNNPQANIEVRQRPRALLETLHAQKDVYNQSTSRQATHRRQTIGRSNGERRTDLSSQAEGLSVTQTAELRVLSDLGQQVKETWKAQAVIDRLSDRKHRSAETSEMLKKKANHLRAELKSLVQKNEEFKNQIRKYQTHITTIEQNEKKLNNSWLAFDEKSKQTLNQAIVETINNTESITKTIQTSSTEINALAETINETIQAETKTLNEAKAAMEKSVTDANRHAEREIDKLAVAGKTFKFKIECDGHMEYLYSPMWDELRVDKHDDRSFKFAMTFSRPCDRNNQDTWRLIHKGGDTYQIQNTYDQYFLKFSQRDFLKKDSYYHAVTSKDEARTYWEIKQVSDTQFTVKKDGSHLNIIGGSRSRPEVKWDGAYFGPRDEIEVWQGDCKINYHPDDDRRCVIISNLYNFWVIEQR